MVQQVPELAMVRELSAAREHERRPQTATLVHYEQLHYEQLQYGQYITTRP
jgi:hypothetical protein